MASSFVSAFTFFAVGASSSLSGSCRARFEAGFEAGFEADFEAGFALEVDCFLGLAAGVAGSFFLGAIIDGPEVAQGWGPRARGRSP